MSIWSKSNYEGGYKDGWYHGDGVFTYPSGVKYQGKFAKGQFHGDGTLVYPNGGYYKGTWDNGKLQKGRLLLVITLKFRGKYFLCSSQSFFYGIRVLLFFEIKQNYGRSGPLNYHSTWCRLKKK